MYYVDTGLYELPTLMVLKWRSPTYEEFCVMWQWHQLRSELMPNDTRVTHWQPLPEPPKE